LPILQVNDLQWTWACFVDLAAGAFFAAELALGFHVSYLVRCELFCFFLFWRQMLSAVPFSWRQLVHRSWRLLQAAIKGSAHTYVRICTPSQQSMPAAVMRCRCCCTRHHKQGGLPAGQPGTLDAEGLHLWLLLLRCSNSGHQREVKGGRAVARYYVRHGSFWQDALITTVWITQACWTMGGGSL
jgi:hypothetical protein